MESGKAKLKRICNPLKVKANEHKRQIKRNRKLTQDPTHTLILLAEDNNSSEFILEEDES